LTDRIDKLLVVVGPTATGKSEIAVTVARRLDGEVISADSMQVYRGMNTGTAKPGPEMLAAVAHHLIDVIDPSEHFTVATFQKAARAAIEAVMQKGRLPILVGGSGLYVRAVIDPLDFPTSRPGSRLRAELEGLGPERLAARLRELDPDAAITIDHANTRRVIRAIEAVVEGQEPLAVREARWRRRRAVYDVLMVGLTLPRPILYERIEQRVDQMIAAGLEDEVRRLMKSPEGLSTTARQALGYKELIDRLEGKISLEQAVELIKRRTRQFAKRQLTWFRADPRIVWLDVDGEGPEQTAERIIELVKAKRFIVI
jgi:tRNA dimethylallyltransferase